MALRIGCAGWSYDDWIGPFYPREIGKKDWLEYYGRFFPTVEINSTFYAVPNRFTVEAWVKKGLTIRKARMKMSADKTPFTFSLKLPQKITHEHMVKWELGKAIDDTKGFERAVLDPLHAEGLVGAVLVQMSPYFKFGPGEQKESKSLMALEGLLEALPTGRYDWAIELRHRSWTEKKKGDSMTLVPEAGELFKRFNIMLCETDGPGFPDLKLEGTKKVYVRFHGRNTDIWFKKGAGSSKGTKASDKEISDDEPQDPKGRFNRYDYLYTEEELSPWKEKLEDKFEEGYVYFNNHPRGKGPKNALMLMDLLGVKHEPKDIMIASQERLF
jgi:uncharacterized protein YecE (DUF72 family)